MNLDEPVQLLDSKTKKPMSEELPELWIEKVECEGAKNMYGEPRYIFANGPSWTREAAIDSSITPAIEVQSGHHPPLFEIGETEIVECSEHREYGYEALPDKELVQMLDPDLWHDCGQPSRDQIEWCINNGSSEVRQAAIMASQYVVDDRGQDDHKPTR